MQCLVVYDIPDDKVRVKIADVCLDYGLDRIQFSAFLGDLARTHQEELLIKVKKAMGKKAGNVQLFPICDKDWRLRLIVAQNDAAHGPEKAEDPKAGDGKTIKGQAQRRGLAQGLGQEPEPEPEEDPLPF